MREYFLWLAKLITIFFIVFIFIGSVIGAIGIQIKDLADKDAMTKDSKNLVAVIELTGEIVDAKETLIALKKVVDNEKVKGIVLRVDSPGGAVGASQDLYAAIKLFRQKKPIIAAMGNVAASGGLYAAMAASKVVAQPGTLTGSIGVIMSLPNVASIADKYGVKFVTVKSGEFKDIGNMFRDMSEAEKLILQDNVDQVQKQFVTAVAEGRGLKETKVREFADGRVFSGVKALEYGLVDQLGGVYDAARLVFQELGKPLRADEQPELFYPNYEFQQILKMLESSLGFIGNWFSTSQSQQLKMYYLL
jgi:protease-4